MYNERVNTHVVEMYNDNLRIWAKVTDSMSYQTAINTCFLKESRNPNNQFRVTPVEKATKFCEQFA